MKFLVTGAIGFVGRYLVEKLICAGHEVDALARSDRGYFKNTALHYFHSFDITHPFSIGDNFDMVIHLAAYNITHVGEISSSIYTEVNVEGTKNVLNGINTRRFVFLSTAKVYQNKEGVLTEESVLGPKQPYEQSKLQAEELCLRLKDQRELVILRSTNVYGPRQPEKAIIPVFFNKAISGEPLKVFGPSGACLQLLYIDDLVSALELAATMPQ